MKSVSTRALKKPRLNDLDYHVPKGLAMTKTHIKSLRGVKRRSDLKFFGYLSTCCKLLFLFCLAAASISFAAANFRAKHNIDIGEFIKEITIINVDSGQTQSAIWLPFEFNTAVSDPEKQADISFLKSYLIFMVNCSIGRDDGQVYASQADIQNRAVLKSAAGARLKPLVLVSPQVQKNLDSIKSAISASAGGNMHMLVFDFKDASGKPMVDAAARDKLTLILESAGSFSRTEFVWHTPFDAVTDAGNCSMCGEKIKAKWNYCPWCGNKL